MDFLMSIDRALLLAINDMHTAYMDNFMMLFSGRWVWIPMYAAIFAAVLWRYGWRRGILLSLAVGLAVAISDQTCASLLRPMAERLRPANLENPLSSMVHIVDGYRGGRYGFPSCHAANTFVLAAAVAILLRRRGVVAFVYAWALMTCYSRIYLGVHYPGDIIVGGDCGYGFGAIVCARRPALHACHGRARHSGAVAKPNALAPCRGRWFGRHYGFGCGCRLLVCLLTVFVNSRRQPFLPPRHKYKISKGPTP